MKRNYTERGFRLLAILSLVGIVTVVTVMPPATPALATGGVTIWVSGDKTVPPGGTTVLSVQVESGAGRARQGTVTATLGTVSPAIVTGPGLHTVTFHAGQQTGTAEICVKLAKSGEIVIGGTTVDGLVPTDSCHVDIVGEGGDDSSDDGSDTRKIGPDDDLDWDDDGLEVWGDGVTDEERAKWHTMNDIQKDISVFVAKTVRQTADEEAQLLDDSKGTYKPDPAAIPHVDKLSKRQKQRLVDLLAFYILLMILSNQ